MTKYAQKPNFIGFYHEYEEHGCFCNWFHSVFEYAGIRFSSVEQYMMYHKVMMFKQFELAKQIISTSDPSTMKKLGRTRFPEFNTELWERTCYAIVKRGIRAKFEQNKSIFYELLDSGEAILAECSGKDTKWGIGVAIDDPVVNDPSRWVGKNYLGRILMEVRDQLRRTSASGNIDYIDARDLDFPLWNELAGTLIRSPKFYNTIHAYTDALPDSRTCECFLYGATLSEWEISMRTNMGGGLPVIGFYELKQDIFDIIRYS